MRVLMVIPSFLPVASGGAEHAVCNIAKGLLTRGITVEVLTYNLISRWRVHWRHLSDTVDGVLVHRWGAINPTGLLDSTRFSRLAKIVLGHQLIPRPGLLRLMQGFDVLHFNDEIELSLPFYTSLTRRPPSVFHHRTLIQCFGFLKTHPLAKFFLRRSADLFLVDSDGYLEKLSQLGVPLAKTRVMRKGVQIERFTPAPFSERMPETILFVGRLDDRLKGADLLLRALVTIRFSGVLEILGGNFAETSYVGELKRIIEESSQQFHVHIHGLVPQHDLPQYYRKATLMVLPARLDSLPNVVLEAMACGLPVVVSRTGGLTELAEGNRAAYGVAPGSVEDLGRAITFLLNSPDTRSKLSSEGRRLVIQNFSFDSYLDSIIEVYQSLLGVPTQKSHRQRNPRFMASTPIDSFSLK